MTQIDFKWINDNMTQLVIIEHAGIAAIYFVNKFINNLLTNCPFLKQNKGVEVLQGAFNALVQMTVKQPPVEVKDVEKEIIPSLEDIERYKSETGK